MSADTCWLCDRRSTTAPSQTHHPECLLREVIGGIGHVTNHEHWCIEQRDPDAGHTYRESSLLVAQWVKDNWLEALP